jgi:hypothetical protein
MLPVLRHRAKAERALRLMHPQAEQIECDGPARSRRTAIGEKVSEFYQSALTRSRIKSAHEVRSR